MSFSPIAELIEEIRQGKLIIMLDDEDRENEGDLIMAAEKVTAWHVNFMLRYGRGLLCMPMSAERCDHLQLPPMVNQNQSKYHTNFTVSIGAASGITTGISAHDRAQTILAAASSHACAEDLVRPGHIFPLRAHGGGVLARQGHTEASVELAELAGLRPAAVLCEVLNEDGTMARREELLAFAKQHGLKVGTVASLVAYRQAEIQSRMSQLNLVES